MEKQSSIEKFNLTQVWNETIERSDRPLKERNYIYASEIGGAFIDRYLKMTAVTPTNPPNSRSMRKFMAGDIWEWIVQTVLVKAGIKFYTQERVEVNYPGCLSIHGKVDFIISGETDFDNVVIDDSMPEFMQRLVQSIVDKFKGRVFEEAIIEIKSVGSFVFEGIAAQDNPKTNHMLQAGVYHKDKGIQTYVIYVCRDDVRILQYSINEVFPDIEQMIIEDVRQMTEYYEKGIEPPKEKLIIWDDVRQKFTKNWKVEYSNYLTMLYSYIDDEGNTKPFENSEEYYEWAGSIVAGMNRVVEKQKKFPAIRKAIEAVEKKLEETPEDKAIIKEHKALLKKLEVTDSNKEWIAKMNEYGYNLINGEVTVI